MVAIVGAGDSLGPPEELVATVGEAELWTEAGLGFRVEAIAQPATVGLISGVALGLGVTPKPG